MDTAKAAPGATPVAVAAGEPPSIGVPSIPVQGDQALVPAPVPSLPVPPAPLPSVPAQLTPLSSSPGAEGGFSPGVAAKLASYVYLLIDPRTGRPFYVGRGRNDRCFRHLAAARAGSGRRRAAPPDPHAGYPVLDRIREVESGGRSVRVDILRYGLSPAEASTVEAAVHEALGLPLEPKLGGQRRPAAELNSQLAKRAKFRRTHRVVLLPVGGTGSDLSYEAIRYGWRIARPWTDLDSPRSPKWAVVVVADLVASVYRIEGWDAEPAPAGGDRPGRALPSPGDRYSLVGSRDPEMEERYAGRSVATYLGVAAPGTVTYVWCGPQWIDTAR